jgi:potassium efflux system protein
VGHTLRLLGVAILGYHLIMRALLVAERRLALKVALERRAARQAQHEEEEGGEAVSVPLDVPRLDRDTLNAQTRGLTRILVGWASVLALFLVWADVLPALKFLDGVSLWHSSETTDGRIVDEAITLADLAIALALGAIFTVGARNIPGVLEVAVLSRLPLDAGLRYAITTLVQYLVAGIGILVVFEAVGVGWGQAQWLVAALGVGLGFGLQEIFANFVSGVIILFERPVRIGDTVTLGDLTGTVSRIRMRATTVTDWDRKEIVIPNKSFITERLINWTLTDPITRVTIPVGVAYGSDTALVERLLHEAAGANQRVLTDPHHQVFFIGFGESSLDFELRVFVDGLPNMLAVRHELHMWIDRSFRDHGVEIAFPQRDLHLRSVVALPGSPLGGERSADGRPISDGPPQD